MEIILEFLCYIQAKRPETTVARPFLVFKGFNKLDSTFL